MHCSNGTNLVLSLHLGLDTLQTTPFKWPYINIAYCICLNANFPIWSSTTITSNSYPSSIFRIQLIICFSPFKLCRSAFNILISSNALINSLPSSYVTSNKTQHKFTIPGSTTRILIYTRFISLRYMKYYILGTFNRVYIYTGSFSFHLLFHCYIVFLFVYCFIAI